MPHRAASFSGWYGIGAVLLAYALLNFGVFDTQNLWYLLLNLTGAIGILFEAYDRRDYPVSFLNIIWALVALYGIARFLIT
jgi:hypothetical protein